MINKFFKYLEARRVYNRTYRELSQLNDKDLNDIGLCRYDIHFIAEESARGVKATREYSHQDYMPALRTLFTSRVNFR